MSVLPRPLIVEYAAGSLTVGRQVRLQVRSDNADGVDRVQRVMAALMARLDAAGMCAGDSGGVPLRIDLDPACGPPGSEHHERYTVRVADDGVDLIAASPVGLHHALGTFVQLVSVPPGGQEQVTVPCGAIHDEPRYAWRGLSVDVARHFFGPAELRRIIDVIARYKMNVLHLHLTDDQGWRLRVPSRPALTDVSAGSDCSGGPGGFVTESEYDELQQYAAERFITIVPEIDVPGHTNAVSHAYGELRPDGVATDVFTGTAVGFSTLAWGLEATEPFLRDVFGDLARMTHGPYLHFGGDEALATDRAEYIRFIQLVESIVRDHGKVPVAWNEAAAAPLNAGTLIQMWDTNHGDLDALRAASERGIGIIMSPGNRAYLDMKYAEGFPLGQDWAGLIELRDAYDWDPAQVVAGLDPAAIHGVEAAVWTETLASIDDVFTMLLPRLAAVAEVAWSSPQGKDFDGFAARIAQEAARWWAPQAMAYHPTPQVDWHN